VAVIDAVAKGWLLAEREPPHSIALTDDGRVMAAKSTVDAAAQRAARASVELGPCQNKTSIAIPLRFATLRAAG
jgi:hypothetical protein